MHFHWIWSVTSIPELAPFRDDRRKDLWRDCRLDAMKMRGWWVAFVIYTIVCIAAMKYEVFPNAGRAVHYAVVGTWWVVTGVAWFEFDARMAHRVLKRKLHEREVCGDCGGTLKSKGGECQECAAELVKKTA